MLRLTNTLDRFDLLVGAVMLALVAAIAGVALAGDRVGVVVDSTAPQGLVSGGQSIRIRFSDPMQAESVEERFHIEPDTPGDFTWIGGRTLLTFTPRQPFAAGQTVTVTLGRGAQAVNRSAALRSDVTWTFTVRLPRAIFLAPADTYARNLTLADLQSGEVYPLTQVEDGIEDFAVSPSGSAVAYSRNNPDGTADIWILDVAANTNRPVTRCVDALCIAPAWKPDETQLVYQRDELNVEPSLASRAWIVDLGTLQTQLLFSDAQILGRSPTWDPTGRRIAVYDPSLPGIRVHDFETQADVTIENLQEAVGYFSPDGSKLVYPTLVRGVIGSQFYTHLEMADFDAVTQRHLSGPEDTPVEDSGGVWSPDGRTLLIARRYLDDRYTAGKQIYLMDTQSGEIEPLIVDAAYNHSGLRWDASGRRIIFQRFSLADLDSHPEIWGYDLDSNTLVELSDNGSLPGWLP